MITSHENREQSIRTEKHNVASSCGLIPEHGGRVKFEFVRPDTELLVL